MGRILVEKDVEAALFASDGTAGHAHVPCQLIYQLFGRRFHGVTRVGASTRPSDMN
jgi:hypothetical protein